MVVEEGEVGVASLPRVVVAVQRRRLVVEEEHTLAEEVELLPLSIASKQAAQSLLGALAELEAWQ